MTVAFVAIGAAFGAPLRYLIDRAVQTRHHTRFPWGTFTVNVLGSFILGLVAGAVAPGTVVDSIVGTGFCGALTTYSTFSYETLRLLERRAHATALANVAASIVVGLGASALGWLSGQAVT
ncbi:MAG: fluoride efflux transporter CrcB [Pseudonocardia sp.]|nr:fluoride efflux transporter CrcB [Pseudonocardia sp.]